VGLLVGLGWVFLQYAHEPEICVFLNLGLSTGHEVAQICKLDLRLETLLPRRGTLNECIKQSRGRETIFRNWFTVSRNQCLFDAEQKNSSLLKDVN
jgi:hypothetical protein